MIVYGILLQFYMMNGNNGQPLSGLSDTYKNFVTGSILKLGGVAIPNYVWFALVMIAVMWFIWNKTTRQEHVCLGLQPRSSQCFRC